jgi:hypothetical protein
MVVLFGLVGVGFVLLWYCCGVGDLVKWIVNKTRVCLGSFRNVHDDGIELIDG